MLARRVATLALIGTAAACSTVANARDHGLSVFNGGWMVSSAGYCTGLGSGQVTIMNGRIIGPNGAGRVTSGGRVTTITNVNGITTVGHGQIRGATAAGDYRQSDGCSGTWTAVKM